LIKVILYPKFCEGTINEDQRLTFNKLAKASLPKYSIQKPKKPKRDFSFVNIYEHLQL
jgi:hypothetical protein